MDERAFQISEYTDRIAIVTDIDRTVDPRYREIHGFWADTRKPFTPQFLPTEMALREGDAVYVVEQTRGKGSRGSNAWVAFTSDKAPQHYWASNAPVLPKRKLVDSVGGGMNALIELAAVVVLGAVGWQYSWWAAATMAVAAAALAWWGHVERFTATSNIKKALQDEALLYPSIKDRLEDKQREWLFSQSGDAEADRAQNDHYDEPRTDRDSIPAEWRTRLRLPDDCSLPDAEKAYRQAMKECHPDVNRNLSPRMRELADQESRLLNDAIEAARSHFATV